MRERSRILTYMTGTFQKFKVTYRSFGQHYTTISGQQYITFFDFTDPNLRGLEAGVTVEFEATAGPTRLCDVPLVTERLPMAKLLRVIRED